ncbi:uncharacterized protein CTRU02_214890 [Colletotrichum truncatum]|uniref:Uncharacterized protein n=1 Tax=Colletotrichum truncatum TaxID=5467 RepID=A0ACC3YE25_COLTU|nr:uncharacterized protein CTRU02_08357 [Colletotrichum truncatum]KAF6790227.1 hypothetical protein CTRU02_08357 [Colletotrichum truncatum]
MTESWNTGSNFGSREGDWPEVDVDSDEEGTEAMRRAEAAMHATIERSIPQRNQHPTHEAIPESLYIKAEKHQDQLTLEERQRLLSRGDVVGKALAYPDSLTIDEIHEVLLWPPVDVVHANIQQATCGTLSTPRELYAKAKDALDRGQFDTMLNDCEIALLSRSFHPVDDPSFSPGTIMEALGEPGNGKALALMSERMGLAVDVLQAAMIRQMRTSTPMSLLLGFSSAAGPSLSMPIPRVSSAEPLQDRLRHRHEFQSLNRVNAIGYPEHQSNHNNVTDDGTTFPQTTSVPFPSSNGFPPASFQSASPSLLLPTSWPAAPPPSRVDLFGAGPWPPMATPCDPIALFRDATQLLGYDVSPGWSTLTEDQKEVYRGRSETLRREAWAEHNAALARQTPTITISSREEGQSPRQLHQRNFSRGERLPGVPRRPALITGLRVFHAELGLGMDFQDVLRRWEGLAEEQKVAYDGMAARDNAANWAAYQQGMS